jgi:hypothetical protein
MMPTLPPLTPETLWAILNNELSDDTVNQLVWHTLGYRYSEKNSPEKNLVEGTGEAAAEAASSELSETELSETELSKTELSKNWQAEEVDEKWREKYPEPPNFIESRPATVQLTRSIPSENKQLLKTLLGFKGYSVDQLVPRLTRRATMANWLLSEMRLRGLV